jgi:hypothetical protein
MRQERQSDLRVKASNETATRVKVSRETQYPASHASRNTHTPTGGGKKKREFW